MGDLDSRTNPAIIGNSKPFDLYKQHFSAIRNNTELFVFETIRNFFPDKHVTATACNLITFAEAGHAEAELDRENDQCFTTRRYQTPTRRIGGGDGKLSDEIIFALYNYTYQGQRCRVYVVSWTAPAGNTVRYHYIITARHSVDKESHSTIADGLIRAAGKWEFDLHDEIYVFDAGSWTKNGSLWAAVQSASWDDVILDPAMKDTLIKDVEDFFDSKSVYEEYSVPWKRGIIFHGTPGCGKTISIKALMNTLQKRDVASLYVKSFTARQGPQRSIRSIFQVARFMAPCILIFEDLDSLVVDEVRSYFLNEVDGLEDNDGILMIGSTNHLERLDPGISKRPSRFDRKYHFKLPGERERIMYCEYWRRKLQKNGKLDFDDAMCRVIAQLTEGFSFAYMKELFVQTLLSVVGGRTNNEEDDNDDEIAITDAADNLVIVGGSTKLAREDENIESTAVGIDGGEDERSQMKEAQMPQVDIPTYLKDNPLMRVMFRQTKALWRDMDNTLDNIHRRPKTSGS